MPKLLRNAPPYLASMSEALWSDSSLVRSYAHSDLACQALSASAQGSALDVAALLANTHGGYLQARRDPQWRNRMQRELDQLVARMMTLGLIETEGDNISLRLLGRACGRSSLSFDSAMRLIEIVKNVLPISSARPI